MKLLLTSAALSNQNIKDGFIKLIGKDPRSVNVAFFPTAANPEPNKKYIKIAIDELLNLGMKVDQIDLENETEQSLKGKLSKYDVLYVNGGNTFYLLDWVRKSGFDKVVSELVNNGKVYVGVSAGSILAGPDIGICSDENIVNLKDLTGLNFISFTISPHYSKARAKYIKEKAKSFKYKIVPITNNQAILVNGNEITII